MTTELFERNRLRRSLAVVAAIALTFAVPRSVTAAEQLRVATQFGLAYLPLIVMQHDKLWEAEARKMGADITVDYRQLGGGASLNDALLSDSVDLVAGGTAPMLFVWDRTASNFKVQAVAALNSSPMYILTNKPAIKTLADLGPQDKIAVPSIKVSFQAIGLMKATEKQFGAGQVDVLTDKTVAMQHPDALAALISPNSPIAAYVSSSPFQEVALKHPEIHKLTDSFAAFDGPSTFSVVYAKAEFFKKHPEAGRAFYSALDQAMAIIAKDPSGSVDKYLEVTGDRTDRALLASIMARPDFTFSATPQRTLDLAQFMYRIGLLKREPKSWQDFFAEPFHDRNGS
jgi:NitT/TauT family transport system substrate-binding protein